MLNSDSHIKTDLPTFNDPNPPSYESATSNSNPPSYESATSDSNLPSYDSAASDSNLPSYDSAASDSNPPSYESATSDSNLPSYESSASDSILPSYESSASDSNPPSYDSTASDSTKMFEEVSSNENDAHLKQIQQKNDLQKEHMDKVALDKEIAAHRHFFALLQNLLRTKLQQDALIEKLEQAAELSGFANLKQALNLAKNPSQQSPLQQAFQQQRFSEARQLINHGAIPGPIERATFKIALDSRAARDFGFAPQNQEKLHPVKNFGLVLEIVMTSKDGTFSQFGTIGPTYQLMTNAVDKYARNNPVSGFSEIADAYKFSNKAVAFSNSTSQRNPDAGQEIASRIQEGKITTIPISFSGHAMGLSVVPDGPNSKSGYLVFTNRGLGTYPGESGTNIYRVNDLSKIDKNFINTVINGHSDGASHGRIMSKISDVTDGAPPIHTISQKAQTIDNCAIANTRSNIHGIVLCQMAREKGGFDKLLQRDFEESDRRFKEFTHSIKADKVIELADALNRAPHDVDFNNLAKEYLKQHSNASPELREPLEMALGRKTQSMTAKSTASGDFDVDFLKPLPNTITTPLPIVEAIQLSAPRSHSSTVTSTLSEELSDENEYSESGTFHY